MKKDEPIIWRKGKKVILRPVEETDLPDMRRWINDPANNQYLLRNWPSSVSAQKAWFDRISGGDQDHIVVAICTHDGTIIGNMSMTIDSRKQSATTGTIIGSHDHKGQGYGTDAKMLMLEYAFNWRNIRRVISPIKAFNGPSKSYAEKCGYRHMATIEQEHFRNGKWYDEEQYVVFRKDWLPLWKKYRKDTPYWKDLKKS